MYTFIPSVGPEDYQDYPGIHTRSVATYKISNGCGTVVSAPWNQSDQLFRCSFLLHITFAYIHLIDRMNMNHLNVNPVPLQICVITHK